MLIICKNILPFLFLVHVQNSLVVGGTHTTKTATDATGKRKSFLVISSDEAICCWLCNFFIENFVLRKTQVECSCLSRLVDCIALL